MGSPSPTSLGAGLSRVTDHSRRRVVGEVELGIVPVHRLLRQVGDELTSHHLRPQVQRQRRSEGVGVSARIARIANPAPDGMVRQVWHKGLGLTGVLLIKSDDGLMEVVAAAPAPNHDAAEALIRQRAQHMFDNGLMEVAREIDVAAAEAAMLGGWTERHDREDEHAEAEAASSAAARAITSTSQVSNDTGKCGPCCSVQPVGTSAKHPCSARCSISR